MRKICINFIDQGQILLTHFLHLILFSTKHCLTQLQEVPKAFICFHHLSYVSLQIFRQLLQDYFYLTDKGQSCQFYHLNWRPKSMLDSLLLLGHSYHLFNCRFFDLSFVQLSCIEKILNFPSEFASHLDSKIYLFLTFAVFLCAFCTKSHQFVLHKESK